MFIGCGGRLSLDDMRARLPRYHTFQNNIHVVRGIAYRASGECVHRQEDNTQPGVRVLHTHV